MTPLRTLTLLTIAVLLGACASLGGRVTTSPTPKPSSSMRSTPKPSASGEATESSTEPEMVTVDDLITDAAAYDGREVVVTATAEREVSPSAWLMGRDATADDTVLMLDNSLHPVTIQRGKTFDIHARVEKYVDPESMTKEIGGLPDMYNHAFTTYEGSYVLVASEVTATE